MKKKWAPGSRLETHEFQLIFDAKVQGPDLVKTSFAGDVLQFKRFGRLTKFDEKWMPKWSQQIIKIEPLGAHGRVF